MNTETPTMVKIRQEQSADCEAIRQLYLAAFDNGPEAMLVDTLRASCPEYLAFVAVEEGEVVGHILFTPVTVTTATTRGMGLAPMGVFPSRQRKGIGSRLVRHGLEFLRKSGCPFVIVLGHPEYYPRFGFEVASNYMLRSQWEGVPDEAFMVIVYNREALPKEGGVVSYLDEFNAAM